MVSTYFLNQIATIPENQDLDTNREICACVSLQTSMERRDESRIVRRQKFQRPVLNPCAGWKRRDLVGNDHPIYRGYERGPYPGWPSKILTSTTSGLISKSRYWSYAFGHLMRPNIKLLWVDGSDLTDYLKHCDRLIVSTLNFSDPGFQKRQENRRWLQEFDTFKRILPENGKSISRQTIVACLNSGEFSSVWDETEWVWLDLYASDLKAMSWQSMIAPPAKVKWSTGVEAKF